mmetsp:Transcript_19309/g.35577  ORF Transcript_19309/g.35577 Transcript_19309/m.35577 type:complete len:245 (-) Transcript_19309:9709-10443(-)
MVDSSIFSSGRLEERSNAYCPVNTGLINLAARVEDENFKIDGEPINMLEIVGKVRNFNNSSMKVEVELHDEYGKVDAVIFKKSTEEPKQLRGFKYLDNGYVHCFGQLKRFYNTTTFVISMIRNVEKYSEVTCHRAKVMWACLYRRGKLKRSESIVNPMIIERSNYDNYAMPDQQQLMNALQPDQRKVLETIMSLRDRHSKTDKDSIFDSLPGKMGLSNFEAALMRLTETGFIYKDDDYGLYYVS